MMNVNVGFTKWSLSDQAQNALKAEILSGQLEPGQRIDLNVYRRAWSISITPLRDAVRSLESAGLVEVSPRRGVFVAQLDRNALREIFELRIGLECIAVELATPLVPEAEARDVLNAYARARDSTNEDGRKRLLSEADPRIHELAVRHCGNGRLTAMIDSIRDLVLLSQRTIMLFLNEPLETTLPEHIAIAEAVCARDAGGANRAMHAHLSNTLRRVETFLEEQGEARLRDSLPSS
jgi:DNA-binding GntR family transcriptional regulator